MAEKWVVTVYGDDGGVYPKVSSGLASAVKYFKEQSGRKLTVEDAEALVKERGYYSVIDDYGRRISLAFREVGTCRVCRKGGVPLSRISVDIYTTNGANTGKTQLVDVCGECYDGNECGCWNLVQQQGRVVVKKQKYSF